MPISFETSSRERLESAIKSPYDPDGEVWSALLAALASEFDAHEDSIDDILDAKFVETADREQLQRIASLFDMQQRDEERVSDFRMRVQTGLRAQLTSATIPEIREMVSVLFNIPEEEFTLAERTGTDIDEHASFRVQVLADVIGSLDVRPSNLNPLLDRVSAAGVNGQAVFLTDDAQLRLVAQNVIRTEPNELADADIQVDAQSVFTTPSVDSDEAALILDTGSVERVKLSNDGLSSDALGPLSSGEWVLSHDDRN